MRKKVAFGVQPAAKELPPDAEAWVEHRGAEPDEATSRLTLDLPTSLHRRIKATCALRGVKMVDEIRALLEQHFPETR